MKEIGKNDFCPCGSGKKYQDCCLQKDKTQEEYNQVRERLFNKLGSFSEKDMFHDIINRAFNSYYDILAVESKTEVSEAEIREIVNIIIFDMYLEDKRIIELFAEQIGEDELTDKEKKVLHDWFGVYYSIYELTNIDENGYHYRDLLTNKTLIVTENEKLTCGDQGDIIMARIAKVGNEYQPLENIYSLTPGYKESIMEILNQLLVNYREEVYQKDGRQPDIKEFLRNCVFYIKAIPYYIEETDRYQEILFEEDEMFDEDLFEAYFAIKSLDFIKEKLLLSSRVIKNKSRDNPSFLWLSEDEADVMGVIYLSEDELVVQTTTKNQLEQGKDFIKGCLGIAAIYLEEEHLRPEELKEELELLAEMDEDYGGLKEDTRQNISEYLKVWADQPMSEFNGKTPRQMSKTARGRQILSELIAEMERYGLVGSDGSGYIDRTLFEELLNLDQSKLEPQDEVEQLLWYNMKDIYTPLEKGNALLLWRDFKEKTIKIRGKNESWAAGVEYIINRLDFVNYSQKEIGDKYGVSSATVSSKYNEIADMLNIIPFDKRYGTVNSR